MTQKPLFDTKPKHLDRNNAVAFGITKTRLRKEVNYRMKVHKLNCKWKK